MDQAMSLLAETYATIKSQVDDNTRRNIKEFASALPDAPPSGLKEQLAQSVSGGKRFRAFCSAVGSATLTGLQQTQTTEDHTAEQQATKLLERSVANPAIRALMTALELYQSAALVHDDIVDRSLERRGNPTAHLAFSQTHKKAGLWGNEGHYGQSGALLAGDFLLAGAEFALSQVVAHTEHTVSAKVIRQYSIMTGEVASGQFQDMHGGFLPLTGEINQSEIEQVVRLKAGRYSVVQPTILGYIAASSNKHQASPKVIQRLEEILEPAGMAFQLRDDALGAFGHQQATGKPVGLDIAEGKRTILLAIALANATETDRKTLLECYGRGSNATAETETAKALLEKYGRKPHEDRIQELTNLSLTRLNEAQFPRPVHLLLSFLVQTLTSREQ